MSLKLDCFEVDWIMSRQFLARARERAPLDKLKRIYKIHIYFPSTPIWRTHKWPAPSWLDSSVGLSAAPVSQRSWVRTPFKLEFFRLYFLNCLSWALNCDDLSFALKECSVDKKRVNTNTGINSYLGRIASAPSLHQNQLNGLFPTATCTKLDSKLHHVSSCFQVASLGSLELRHAVSKTPWILRQSKVQRAWTHHGKKTRNDFDIYFTLSKALFTRR